MADDFLPVYEEDESAIRDRELSRIDDTWRKDPGDFIYDAVATTPAEIKQLQVNQDSILKNAFAMYAEGEYLDRKLSERGLTREPATAAKRVLNITGDAGVVIPAGQVVSTVVLDGDGDPIEFTTDVQTTFNAAGTLAVNITAETAGEVGNVPDGTTFILAPPIAGISVVVDGGSTALGTDEESDAAAYARYDFEVRNPDTGGNKNDYVRWAEAIEGVGKAKCIPRWNGNGTVKVVIVGTDYRPALQALVDTVQTTLDPGSTGLGDGQAPCGASVTVEAALAKTIDITATVTYSVGYDPTAVKTAFEASVTDYLKSLIFQDNVSVVVTKIGGLLIGTDGVSNYSGLTVNGGTADVPIGPEEDAVLGTVTI